MTASEHTAAEVPPSQEARPSAAMRCTHADRERVCAVLHEAAGDGRLGMDETEDRLGRAYAARYHHELDALVTDLAAPGPTGWALAFATARRQLVEDLAVLVGRAPGSRARRLRTLAVVLAMLMVVAAVGYLMLHGMLGDGFEHGQEFGDLERG